MSKSENIDHLYEWIKKIINSCEYSVHIEPCKELIAIFKKKNPPSYLVDNLTELINIHEQSLSSHEKKDDKASIEDRIYELFKKGVIPKEIANTTSQKYQYVLSVINAKMRDAKK